MSPRFRSARVLSAIGLLVFLGIAVFRHFHPEAPPPAPAAPPPALDLAITDGSRLRFEGAGISVAPDAGWGVQRFVAAQVDPARPQLCSPMLQRPGAQIAVVVLPADPATVEVQAGNFLRKLSLEELHQEALTTASGVEAVHARGMSGKSTVKPVQMDFYFLRNAAGRLAVVYATALPNESARFTDWFPKTVQVEPK